MTTLRLNDSDLNNWELFARNTNLLLCDVDNLVDVLGYERARYDGFLFTAVTFQAIRMGLKPGPYNNNLEDLERYHEELVSVVEDMFPLKEKLEELCGGPQKYQDFLEKNGYDSDVYGYLAAAKYHRPVVVFDAWQGVVCKYSEVDIHYFSTFGELQDCMRTDGPILIYYNSYYFDALVPRGRN